VITKIQPFGRGGFAGSSLIIHNPAIKMAVTAIYAVVRTQ
jgi:hypothetical protein